MSQQVQNSHSQFSVRLRKLRSLYQGTKNVAIYAFSLGKILDVRKVAGVKDMTNIMSDYLQLGQLGQVTGSYLVNTHPQYVCKALLDFLLNNFGDQLFGL